MKWLVALLLAGIAYGLPVIDSINGTPLYGGTVTISGNGFGTNGPNIDMFDDFERGSTGQVVSTGPAVVGEWDSANMYYQPLYDDLSWTSSRPHGNMSFRTGMYWKASTSQSLQRQLRLDWFDASGKGYDEVFMSYNFMIPDGTLFPMAAEEETFSSGSNWKMSWIMSDHDTSYNDICIPTYYSTNSYALAGNSHLIDIDGSDGFDAYDKLSIWDSTPPSWWQWGGWMRISVWLKADPQDRYGFSGIADVQMLKEGYGITEFNHENVKLLHDSHGNKLWESLAFPGWIRTGMTQEQAEKTAPMYDDIYVALGQGSASRVEIGDKPAYSECTRLAIATPTSWSDTSIDVVVRKGGFESIDGTYLFVIDADNKPSAGYKISSGNTHAADADSDGLVSITELIEYMDQWKTGSVTITEVMGAIQAWKEN